MIGIGWIKKYDLHPPFFLYREDLIKKRFFSLKKLLPGNFEIFYSVKSNPNIHILKIFRQMGAGAEISSGGELVAAMEAGFLPGKIIFTGVGKTAEELEYAVKKKIFLIIAESVNEIKKISNITSRLKMRQDILLRINPSFISSSMFPMTGGAQKFGIDEEKIPDIIRKIKNLRGVNLLGLHLFAGSNIFDGGTILRNTEYLFKIAHFLEARFKINFRVLDIGGGLPIHYSGDSKFDIKKLTSELENLTVRYGFNGKKIIVESGRFLVGGAGDYVTRVVDKKISRGEVFVIIDGGINHFSRANLPKENLAAEILFVNVKNSTKKKNEFVNLAGNLSTPADFMFKTFLPNTEIGDLIVIKNTGAYGFTAGSVLFSSRPMPNEYLLAKGKIKTIQKPNFNYWPKNCLKNIWRKI